MSRLESLYTYTAAEIEAARFGLEHGTFSEWTIRNWFTSRGLALGLDVKVAGPGVLRVAFQVPSNGAGVLETFCRWANEARPAGIVCQVHMTNTYTGAVTTEVLGS